MIIYKDGTGVNLPAHYGYEPGRQDCTKGIVGEDPNEPGLDRDISYSEDGYFSKSKVVVETSAMEDDNKMEFGKMLYSTPARELFEQIKDKPDSVKHYVRYCIKKFGEENSRIPRVKLVLKNKLVIGLRFDGMIFTLWDFIIFVKTTFGAMES